MVTGKTRTLGKAPRQRFPALSPLPSWKLEEAKARFSELVRLAREQGPQRVTVHGDDAVVVVSAATFARMLPAAAPPSLHTLLSQSPLRDLEVTVEGVRSPVRDVPL